MEELLRSILLNDNTAVQEYHAVCDCLGKRHLVRYYHHGSSAGVRLAALCEVENDVKNLVHHFRVKRS